MPDGGALTPLKVEITEIGFPPGIWKILLGDGVVCEKAMQRVLSGSCELERSTLCLPDPPPSHRPPWPPPRAPPPLPLPPSSWQGLSGPWSQLFVLEIRQLVRGIESQLSV